MQLHEAIELVRDDAQACDDAHPHGDGEVVAALEGRPTSYGYTPETLRRERVYLHHEGHLDLIPRLSRVEDVVEMRIAAVLAAQPNEYPNDPGYWRRTYDSLAARLTRVSS